MTNAILVLNAGSSSLKFSLFAEASVEPAVVTSGQIGSLDTSPHFIVKDSAGQTASEKRWAQGTQLGHDGAVAHIVDWLKATYASHHQLVAVGHRVVHGGVDYSAPVRIDWGVVAKLEKLIPLAPLHQPHNLAPIRSLLERAPQLPQVACFDTAFHRSNPPLAQMFALPSELTESGVRRYGFHGLSYEYIASVLPKFDERAARGKTVVLHLGNGASMCALQAGASVASTMGFTALDGLPMGTRCGAIDPGVILYLMDERKMDTRAIEKLLYNESGLLGVSGISSDMRTLLASSDPRARLAIDLYCYRIRRELGSLAAALGGLDAMAFTGGIGENSAAIRERVCRDAAWLGVELDAAANGAGGPRISTPEARASAWTIPTNEELMIARHTRRLLYSPNL
jgi:acetate kinase